MKLDKQYATSLVVVDADVMPEILHQEYLPEFAYNVDNNLDQNQSDFVFRWYGSADAHLNAAPAL
ncbi:hypothetical protein [Acinetobacter seifertii]|uniref:hypothetical protein n=1 Tax=Acinetobacter seifertii TaxID=1530123 RepID=UPI001C07242B|nr:hypothetical protein [Acinetobacter seifertii]